MAFKATDDEPFQIFTMTRWVSVLTLGALALGCQRGADGEPPAPTPEPASADVASAPLGDGAAPSAGAGATSESFHFPVPFAWESSRDEPLAQARHFLQDLLVDNRSHMGRGSSYFSALRNAEKPRATVVACSDSRVQSSAFDGTPENDAFTVRNLGNQIDIAAGSVEYGVTELGTPLLLVLGHTGCGAVEAVISGKPHPNPAVRAELERITLPRPKRNANVSAAAAHAVVENVHAQVASALTRFGPRVQAGKLTVVGAVYDLRDDLGRGAGHIEVVNVNGNAESSRMRAFVEAVRALPGGKPGRPGARGVENASVRIEETLLETLREAARIEVVPAPRSAR